MGVVLAEIEQLLKLRDNLGRIRSLKYCCKFSQRCQLQRQRANGHLATKADQNVLKYEHARKSAQCIFSLYINNDIKLNYSQVIDQFAKGNRRLNLK